MSKISARVKLVNEILIFWWLDTQWHINHEITVFLGHICLILRQNVFKSCVGGKITKCLAHSYIRLIFLRIIVHSDFHPWGIFFKSCAIWVKILLPHNVRENQADAAGRTAFDYFSSIATFKNTSCLSEWKYVPYGWKSECTMMRRKTRRM